MKHAIMNAHETGGYEASPRAAPAVASTLRWLVARLVTTQLEKQLVTT